jgi:hypothetical protein
VLPRQLAEAVAIITPEVSISIVRKVCTNFLYVLFYLIRKKRLDVQLPKVFVDKKPQKKVLDTIKCI